MIEAEKHYTPTEVAELWGLSPDTVRDLFREVPGVLKIERPRLRTKRGYASLRIPASVLAAFHQANSGGWTPGQRRRPK